MIHRFRVQNFKSIRDVSVDFSPVTVLVGKSGTGKSNFVESMRFIRDALISNLSREKWNQIRPATRSDTQTSFEVEFSITGIEERFGYALTCDGAHRGEQPVEEKLVLGEKTLFHQKVVNSQTGQTRWVIEPSLIAVPPPGPLALGRIPSISEVVIAFTALTTGIGCYLFADTVLCDATGGSASGLNGDATNYLQTLKEIVSNLQDLNVRKSLVSALQRLNPSVSSVELDSIQQPKHVVVGHKYDGRTLSLQLRQESVGFRRFYAHLLAIYQRPPKQTLIFEHPEDGIHPGALAILAEEFKAAPEDGRGQVILTTHSPMFLDHFDVDQIRVVELRGFETRIGRVSSEQFEAIHENLLSTGELLTVDPARIESSAPEAAGA